MCWGQLKIKVLRLDEPTFKSSYLFSDTLPDFMTLKAIEKVYSIKPQTIRNLLSRNRIAGIPSPFIYLPGCKPLLIKRTSFEDWLLAQSNVIRVKKEG
jgi:hypothetical protein